MIAQKYRRPRPDPKQDPEYRRWIISLPCVVCQTWHLHVRGYAGRTECAHVGARGLGQKCSDRETLPLCVWHHRLGPAAVHTLGKGFWAYWKLVRPDLIATLNRRFQGKEKGID